MFLLVNWCSNPFPGAHFSEAVLRLFEEKELIIWLFQIVFNGAKFGDQFYW